MITMDDSFRWLILLEMVMKSYECCNVTDEVSNNHYWRDHGYITKELCLTICIRDAGCKVSEVLGSEDDLGKYKCYTATIGEEISVSRSECNTNLDKRCYIKMNKSG